jgi:LysR family transcriptional regulator, regulator for bpeEF and oprC
VRGVTPSGISNAISRLEDRLGVRLLARTTRRVNLTEDGAAFFDRCRRILADLEEAELVLSRARLAPAGRLRVDMPLSFGQLKVVPLMGALREMYPDLVLFLSFTDRIIDLVEEGIDVAVRVGALRDSSLISRRVTQTRFRVYGTPGYFAKHGRPRALEDLKDHNCLGYAYRETGVVRDWRFHRDGAQVNVIPQGNMTFTDGTAVCAAACAGYGLVQMPNYYAETPTSAEMLEPVLVPYEPSADLVSLVYPSSRHLSPKVRAFFDFMTSQFG